MGKGAVGCRYANPYRTCCSPVDERLGIDRRLAVNLDDFLMILATGTIAFLFFTVGVLLMKIGGM